MNERDLQLEEVGRLTGLLLADALDDAGRRRLEESLLADQAAMEYYQDYVDVHCLLHWRHGLSEEQELHELGARTEAESLVGAAAEQSSRVNYEIDLAVSASLPTTHHPLSANFIGGPVFSYMVATVVLCAMLLGAWAYKITSTAGEYAGDRQHIGASDTAEFVVVGRVTGITADCRWADPNSAAIIGAAVSKGRCYSLASGLMEITYDCGAKVILEGPCEYTVDSDTGGHLSRGRMTARVENRGEKSGRRLVTGAKPQAANPQSPIPSPSLLFAVRTPTAVVTDLGTEFGVEVAESGQTTTSVFVGRVRLDAVNSAGKATATIELTENQTGVVASADVTAIARKNDALPSFVRAMPRSDNTQEAEAYAELVLSLNPVAYYRMERPADGADPLTMVDSTSGRRHGTLYGAGRDSDLARLWTPGRFGGALRLRGEFFGDYAAAPSLPSTDSNQLSCSVWVYLENTDSRWPHIVAEGGGRTNVRFKLTLREYSGCPCGRVTAQTGEYRELGDKATESLPLRKWQHLALVADGSNVKLYQNGVETASMPCNGVSAKPLGGQLLIGCANMATEPDEMLPEVFWNGQIDELAVFHRALLPDEIKSLSGNPADRNGDGVSSTLEHKNEKETDD